VALRRELASTTQAFEEVTRLAEEQMRELASLEDALVRQAMEATQEAKRAEREAALAEQMSMQICSTSSQQQVQLIQSARQVSMDAKSAAVEIDRFAANTGVGNGSGQPGRQPKGGGERKGQRLIVVAKDQYQRLSQQAATLAHTQMAERTKRQPIRSPAAVAAALEAPRSAPPASPAANEMRQQGRQKASPLQGSPASQKASPARSKGESVQWAQPQRGR
jgi:hypothetical protein